MIINIRHIGLVVSDLQNSIIFWRDIMGFTITRQMEEMGPHIDAMMGLQNVRVTTVKLSAPDKNIIELLYFHSHRDKNEWSGKPYSTGLTHIAFTVQNIDEIYLRLQSANVKFPSNPQLSIDGLAKVIYARGPEGILLELVQVISS